VAMRLIMQSRGLSFPSSPSRLAADQVKEFQRLGHAWVGVRLDCRDASQHPDFVLSPSIEGDGAPKSAVTRL
jgi:hypothetical protein